MASRFSPVDKALAFRREALSADPFSFLRGTFYWWLVRWDALMPAPVRDAPAILAVGDLHMENFGTWRDREGRLVWGINDFDECHTFPITLDFVRLATSILLAINEGYLKFNRREACASLLAGYNANLIKREGRPVILEGDAAWILPAATPHWSKTARYWRKEFGKLEAAHGMDDLRELLAERMPEGVPIDEFLDRWNAGKGSLGRPRAVALGKWRGGPVAREGKRTLPSAGVWHAGGDALGDAILDYSMILASSYRAFDPCFMLTPDWVIRRLSPENHKINMDQLKGHVEAEALIRWMGWELANIHRGQAGRHDIEDWLAALPPGWLYDSARTMAEATKKDWKAFK
ncbi:MAG: DUF2252 family protein [Rhodospirillaceae bacterium]|nr:DUF2252 family protein [Rhodospirillales bacterium]